MDQASSEVEKVIVGGQGTGSLTFDFIFRFKVLAAEASEATTTNQKKVDTYKVTLVGQFSSDKMPFMFGRVDGHDIGVRFVELKEKSEEDLR